MDATMQKRNWPRVRQWLPREQVSVCTQLALFNMKGSILWDSPLLMGCLSMEEMSCMCVDRNGDAKLQWQETQAQAQAIRWACSILSHVQLRQGMEVIQLLNF